MPDIEVDGIRAKRLVITDESGKPRFTVDGCWPDGTCTVHLQGGEGGSLVCMAGSDGGIAADVTAAGGQHVLWFRSKANGDVFVQLQDPRTGSVIVAGLGPTGPSVRVAKRGTILFQHDFPPGAGQD